MGIMVNALTLGSDYIQNFHLGGGGGYIMDIQLIFFVKLFFFDRIHL